MVMTIRQQRHDRAIARDGTVWPNQLWVDWYESIHLGNPNDFVFAISASGKSSMSGTGKTTCGVTHGKHFDTSAMSSGLTQDEKIEAIMNGRASGFDGEDNATLSLEEFAEEIPNIDDNSAIIYDEAQGIGDETGLDKRRSMKTETLQAINNILANRDKSLTIIIIAQHLPSLDKRLPGLLDNWLLITKGADEPDGPVARYHDMYLEDYNFGSPSVKTPKVDKITWDAIPDGDADYLALEKKKQEAKQIARENEEDRELPKSVQAELAWNIKESRECPWRDVPDHSDRLTFSGDYLRRIAKDELDL